LRHFILTHTRPEFRLLALKVCARRRVVTLPGCRRRNMEWKMKTMIPGRHSASPITGRGSARRLTCRRITRCLCRYSSWTTRLRRAFRRPDRRVPDKVSCLRITKRFASHSGTQYQSIIDMGSASGAFYCYRTRESGSLVRDGVSDVFDTKLQFRSLLRLTPRAS
jgi:hypothetical protein